MAPVHSPLVRAELDTSKHSAVDAFLKSLKQHTRTLSALYSQHTTELAVLERIYYINNNQHRAALFWKRVVEARRYALRLKSLGVLAHVNALRAAFYGSPVDTSSKPSKGAWTHYPQARFLRAFLAHLHTCVTLLDETSTRALAVYGILTLAMQNGAFLHLMLTLAALVARLAHLSSALRRALYALHSDSLKLANTLYPTESSASGAAALPPPPVEAETTNLPVLPSNSKFLPIAQDGDMDVSVDLGEAITRTIAPSTKPSSPAPAPLHQSLQPTLDPVPVPIVPKSLEPTPPSLQPHPCAPSALPQSLNIALPVVVVKKKRSALPTGATEGQPMPTKRVKGKKARRDEIDDIFS